jgi:hypothetical protein
MTDDHSRPSAAWSAVTLLLCLSLYVVSYAPVYRLVEGPDAPPSSHGCGWPRYDQRPWESVYLPVMLLMDHTPLQRPLLAWAEVWQVDERFFNELLLRAFDRYESEP